MKGPRDALESIRMQPEFAPFEKKGDTIQLRASAFDEKGRFLGPADVSWDSSDRTVATVSQTGLVTILSSGRAEIRAESRRTPSLGAALPITAVIEKSLRIVEPAKSETLELPLGKIVEFRAEVLNDRDQVIEGAKVSWESTSYAATVTPTGEVEARAIGTTQVIAESKAGHVDRRDIMVIDWAPKRRRQARR